MQNPRLHISLGTRDLDRAVDFYTRAFGPPTKRRADYARFELAEPGLNLSLNPSEAAAPALPFHLGVQLPDRAAVDGWRDRLASAGVELRVEEQTECCYAELSRVWMQDPDGHLWEIFTNLNDETATRAKGECCQPVTKERAVCC